MYNEILVCKLKMDEILLKVLELLVEYTERQIYIFILFYCLFYHKYIQNVPFCFEHFFFQMCTTGRVC